MCLRPYIELWEQKNQEVHDPTNHLHLKKERLAKEISTIQHELQQRIQELYDIDEQAYSRKGVKKGSFSQCQKK